MMLLEQLIGPCIYNYNCKIFKNKKCVGALLEKEINAIDKVLKNGVSPVLAILGGAKVSSKITIIESLLEKVDHLMMEEDGLYIYKGFRR